MNTDKKEKIKIKYYWYAWMCIAALLFLIRFTFGLNFNEIQRFALFAFYAVPTWLTQIGINVYEGHQFIEYLRMNHHEKWEEITSGPFWGPGGCNSFRFLPFLFSDDNLEDENVKILKERNRKILLLTLTVFFTFIPIAISTLSVWRI